MARDVEQRYLSAAEITKLFDATEDRYSAMVLVGGYAGLRFGEVAGLRLSSLDLLRRRLAVSATLSEVQGKLWLSEPKTTSSRRQVAIPPFLVEALAAHVATFPPGRDGLLFTSTEGLALRRSNFRRRAWLPAVRASVGEPFRFHDLRHTHAAMLIAQGEHPKLIQLRLGHSSIRVTLDTYGHLFDGLDDAAAARLEEVHSAARVAQLRPGPPDRVVPLWDQTTETPTHAGVSLGRAGRI